MIREGMSSMVMYLSFGSWSWETGGGNTGWTDIYGQMDRPLEGKDEFIAAGALMDLLVNDDLQMCIMKSENKYEGDVTDTID